MQARPRAHESESSSSDEDRDESNDDEEERQATGPQALKLQQAVDIEIAKLSLVLTSANDDDSDSEGLIQLIAASTTQSALNSEPVTRDPISLVDIREGQPLVTNSPTVLTAWAQIGLGHPVSESQRNRRQRSRECARSADAKSNHSSPSLNPKLTAQ